MKAGLVVGKIVQVGKHQGHLENGWRWEIILPSGPYIGNLIFNSSAGAGKAMRMFIQHYIRSGKLSISQLRSDNF